MGMTHIALAQHAQKPGFPFVNGKAGSVRYRLPDVKAWLASNVGPRHDAEAIAAQPGGPIAKQDDPFIVSMLSGVASAVEISRMAMQLASRRVANAAIAGTLGPNDLDGLKKTLEELRKTEVSHIELEKMKGGLIDAEDVEALLAYCASRLVRCCLTLENSIATEFSVWLGDPKTREMDEAELSRMVRDFVAKTCTEVRRLESQSAAALIRELNREDDDDDRPSA